MSCVIRAYGKDFDVDAFVKDSALQRLIVVRGGEARDQSLRNPKPRQNEHSGMNISVSNREFSDINGQIEDAIRFLVENRQELQRLRSFAGLDTLTMDFPIEERDAAFQSDAFPARLLLLLSGLDIGLAVSRYPKAKTSQS